MTTKPTQPEDDLVGSARRILARLCGKGLLRMSLPVRPDDEDMILEAVIDRAALASPSPQPAEAEAPAAPIGWLRDQRGEYEGRATLDTLFVLGAQCPSSRHCATYSPVYLAPKADSTEAKVLPSDHDTASRLGLRYGRLISREEIAFKPSDLANLIAEVHAMHGKADSTAAAYHAELHTADCTDEHCPGCTAAAAEDHVEDEVCIGPCGTCDDVSAAAEGMTEAEVRSAFRAYDGPNGHAVRNRTAWQIWRDAVEWATERPAIGDAKDAERYRWLRDTGDATWRPFGIRAGYSAAAADAAIDAAIASTQEGGKP